MKCASLGIRSRTVKLLLLAVIAGAHTLSATTLVVGTCKAGGYSTIQAAINAAPLGATVQVCPGNYPEQVTITQGVTLQGITANNGDRAVIIRPDHTGVLPNATDLFGDLVAAQILAKGSAGPVNISNLWIEGLANNVPPGILIAGIYYQNSPGTINGVTTTNQAGNSLGIGIFLEGGASSPSVTVQNSYVTGFDYAGIDFETVNQPNTALTTKITNNYVNVLHSSISVPTGIQFGSGTTTTVSGNSVVGSSLFDSIIGILIAPGAAGSVSGNSVTATTVGINTSADSVSVTSNKLSGVNTGVIVSTSIGAVKNNIILGLNPDYGVGINFNCSSNPNVLSNTINLTKYGLLDVPTGLSTSTNKVFNATVVRFPGCP